jgi:hypothetical protein
VNALSFNSNGQLPTTGNSDKTVILWDLSDPTRPARAGTLIGDGREVYAVAFGPDGRLLVTGSGTRHSVSLGNGNHVSYSDGAVALGNLADRSHQDRVDTVTLTGSTNDGKVHAVAFSPDGRLIATTGDPGTAQGGVVGQAGALAQPVGELPGSAGVPSEVRCFAASQACATVDRHRTSSRSIGINACVSRRRAAPANKPAVGPGLGFPWLYDGRPASMWGDPSLRQVTQPQHALGKTSDQLRSPGRMNGVGGRSHGEGPYRARNVA